MGGLNDPRASKSFSRGIFKQGDLQGERRLRNNYHREYPACKIKRCCNCKSWDGIGEVDHSHCKDQRSPHQTTSKYGRRKYDICLYFKWK